VLVGITGGDYVNMQWLGGGRVLVLGARLAAQAGDEAAAKASVEASLTLISELGDQPGLIYARRLAAYSALDRSDWADAARHLKAMLTIAREAHDQAALVRALEAIGELLTGLEEPKRALCLAGTADVLRQTLAVRTVPMEAARLDRSLELARRGLGQRAKDDGARHLVAHESLAEECPQPALLGRRDQLFAISVVVLAAKLAKCDGQVRREEIDAPAGQVGRRVPLPGFYFLWSVERVGLLYDLPALGERDWYRWGAEALVANQTERGDWRARIEEAAEE